MSSKQLGKGFMLSECQITVNNGYELNVNTDFKQGKIKVNLKMKMTRVEIICH